MGDVPPAAGDSVAFGVHRLPIWPAGQEVVNWRHSGILVTQFADHGLYAPALRDTLLDLSSNSGFTERFDKNVGVGTAKIFDIDRWPGEAAALIHARALAFFRFATGSERVALRRCWGSLYLDGDFCLPHSHPRTSVSVLYALDLGEAGDEGNGRFYFGDPRLAACCREEEGYMSTPSAPILKPGTMLLFPGKAVHFVSPYFGERPRLTLSWNLNREARPESALSEGAAAQLISRASNAREH